LFRDVEDDVVTMLARQSVRRRFERGQRVWRAGESAACMAVIASGLVKIVQRTPDGHDAILALFGPHESFGEFAVVAGGAYTADAVAATREVEIVCIPAAAVRSAMESRPLFARAMDRSLIAHGRVLEEKILIMSAGFVEQRLAALLRHLVDRFGDELDDGSSIVPVALSRGELASLVGATIETTIRTMSRWQKEGMLSTVPEGFIVHRPARLTERLTAH
jgi:CRP-like cAMP-binding protein